MGNIKEYYIDNFLNEQQWVTNVHLICPSCADEIWQEVPIPEPDLTAEKTSDMTVSGEVEIYCDGCANYFDGDVWAGPTHCDITLRDYPETQVSCDEPGYNRPPEDWLEEWQTPEQPQEIFDQNHGELLSIISTQVQTDGGSLMNRMIFAQILTFVEAYFCDALVNGLRNHPEKMVGFAEKDGSINDTEIKASQVLKDPEIVTKIIEKSLKSRLYHKFGSGTSGRAGKKPKVEGVSLWYRHAFGFALTPNDDDLEALRKYATLRHDCVHRNGETKDGHKLDIFDKAYLLEALGTAKRVVEHIETEMKKLETSKPFPF